MRKSDKMFVCKYCGSKPELKTSLQVYGRKISDYNFYWVCPLCDAMVGCKPGTFTPMGDLADKETRALRIQAHKAFDPLWRKRYMQRNQAYDWLARQLRINPKLCHFSLMSKENLIKSKVYCENFIAERELKDGKAET